jgi:hypothetical protein
MLTSIHCAQDRCILCGENGCKGCSALLHRDYLQGRSERCSKSKGDTGREDKKTTRCFRESCSHQKSRGSCVSVKKDACFYSQITGDSFQVLFEETAPMILMLAAELLSSRAACPYSRHASATQQARECDRELQRCLHQEHFADCRQTLCVKHP